MLLRTALVAIFLLIAAGIAVGAAPAGLPATLGEMRSATLESGETLMELACRMRVGYLNLTAANPDIDPWRPPAGAEIVLPTATVLPTGLKPGITINLAEFRLYFLTQEKGKRRLRVYPIGIGREGWLTPEGDFAITGKTVQPAWRVPASIRAEKPDLPAVVPPGPDNPLGGYWLQLSAAGYGIHGTNQPMGVGRQISHGCIRLYPDDIRELFALVRVGTPVRIVYQPIKLGREGNQLRLEVHADFLGKIADPLQEVLRQKHALDWQGPLHYSTVKQIVDEAMGIPLPLLQEPSLEMPAGNPLSQPEFGER